MNINNEERTIFFDRLQAATRLRKDGTAQALGNSLCLRIVKNHRVGSTVTSCVTLQSAMSTMKLCASTTHDVHSVSACGKVVTIPFILNESCKQKKHVRFFSLTFFDQVAALLFFDSYQQALIPNRLNTNRVQFSFNDLVLRSVQVQLHQTRAALEKKRKTEEGKKDDDEDGEEIQEEDDDDDEVWSDGNEEMGIEDHSEKQENNCRQKRRRINAPADDPDDPAHKVNRDFFDDQFGHSQAF